jgi:O-antigen/teichoic acid export membrane protein
VRELGDDATLGIFAALLYASMAPRMFFAAAGQAASPRLANLYEGGRLEAFRSLHRKLLQTGCWIGAVSLAGAALLGRLFLHIAYGAAYVPYLRLFILLTAVRAVIHLVSAQEYSVTATRAFRAQLPVAAVSAATTIAAAFLLTPALGLEGAAAAMLAGALVQGAGYTAILHRQLQRRHAASLACEAA